MRIYNTRYSVIQDQGRAECQSMNGLWEQRATCHETTRQRLGKGKVGGTLGLSYQSPLIAITEQLVNHSTLVPYPLYLIKSSRVHVAVIYEVCYKARHFYIHEQWAISHPVAHVNNAMDPMSSSALRCFYRDPDKGDQTRYQSSVFRQPLSCF